MRIFDVVYFAFFRFLIYPPFATFLTFFVVFFSLSFWLIWDMFSILKELLQKVKIFFLGENLHKQKIIKTFLTHGKVFLHWKSHWLENDIDFNSG